MDVLVGLHPVNNLVKELFITLVTVEGSLLSRGRDDEGLFIFPASPVVHICIE